MYNLRWANSSAEELPAHNRSVPGSNPGWPTFSRLEELKPLIRIQEIDLELKKIELKLKREIPERIREVREGREKAEVLLKQVEDKFQANLKRRMEIDLEIKSIEEKIKKHSQDLLKVDTNEAYRALQREIEEEKEKKSRLEDEVLELLIQEEELQKEKKKAEEEVERIKNEFAEKEKELLKEEESLKARMEDLRKEREKLASQAKPSLYKLYIQIASTHGGIALSPVHDGFCSVCQMKIRPQLMEELRKGEKIIRCENCSRILYIPEPKLPEN